MRNLNYKNGELSRKRILAFILQYQEENQRPPSFYDISGGVSLDISNIAYHIRKLIERGYLLKEPHQHRTLRVTEAGYALIEVDLDTASVTLEDVVKDAVAQVPV